MMIVLLRKRETRLDILYDDSASQVEGDKSEHVG